MLKINYEKFILQVQVSTNQLRRQEEEKKIIRDELEKATNRERDLLTKLREQQHRYTDLESKVNAILRKGYYQNN